MVDSTGKVTRLVQRWSEGEEGALDALVDLVYDDLRLIAHRHLRRAEADSMLDTTALVHEAYLRLDGVGGGTWKSRGHFFAFCSQAMRHVLVDYARRRSAAKRPQSRQQVQIETAELGGDFGPDLITLDQVLEQLAEIDPRQARIVELRYFAGLSLEDTASTLQLSKSTVIREWRMARAWLERKLA